jgi:hypothetical protein
MGRRGRPERGEGPAGAHSNALGHWSGESLEVWEEQPNEDTEHAGDDQGPGELRVDGKDDEAKPDALGIVDDEQREEEENDEHTHDAGDSLPVAGHPSFHAAPS